MSRWSAAIRVVLIAMLFAAVVALVTQLVPGAAHRLRAASPAWLAVAVLVECGACLGYALLFHAVFSRPPNKLAFERSAKIALGELAGYAIVPTGLGGPAVRFWALRRSGMTWRTIVIRSISHAAIFNVPYVLVALLLGLGVALSVGPGHAPLAVALAPAGVVAVTGLVAIAITAAARSSRLQHHPRLRDIVRVGPDGIRDILPVARRPASLVGAFAWWVGDCAALLVCFHACGGSPPVGVVALAYMLGQLGNLLPLPGGVGGVEPVMLGVLTASGVGTGLGAAAIVCYRAIALGFQGASGSAAVVSLVHTLRGAERV